MRCLLPAIGLLLSAGAARADRPVGEELLDIADTWSNEVGVSVRDLTFNLVDMRFDVRSRTARVRLGAGGGDFGLRFDSRVTVMNGYARVKTHCDLALAGARLQLNLPQFELAGDSVYGERAVVLRVPILEGRF